jgi:transcriptional regulator with XRE-family HTH domain
MNAHTLKDARRERGLTQKEAATRLGVSQPYLALLESGKRPVTASLARKAVHVLGVCPTLVPCDQKSKERTTTTDSLARQLSALGYPGFKYMRAGWTRNPAEVLVSVLQQEEPDSRVVEALPWVLLNFPDLDRDWLLREARTYGLTNRLGFLVSMAMRLAEQRGDQASVTYRNLTELGRMLEESRLVAEDTFGKRLSPTQEEWLRQNRPADAEQWRVLTTWKPEHLQYA